MKTVQIKTEAVKVRKVEIELPEGLYDLMEKVCKIQRRSVNEFIVWHLVGDLNMELEDDLGSQFDIPRQDGEYRDYLESLAYPDPAAQEVTA